MNRPTGPRASCRQDSGMRRLCPGLRELTRTRLLLFLREPEALFWVFAFPVILALVLAFAFKERGVAPSKIGVLGGRETPVAAALARSPELEVQHLERDQDAERRLARGSIDLLVEPGEPPLLRYDEQRSEAATARLRVQEALRAHQGAPEVSIRRQPVESLGSRYIDFLFPGLLGMNIMGTGLWSLGFAVAEQRQKRLLRRLLVTPMRRSSFLLSFVTARLVFLLLEVAVLLAFGLVILGVPLLGSALVFSLLCVLAAMAFVGVGLLVASRARRIESISSILNLVMMPMWLCSGVFFSYERFPEVVHPLCRALPLTALTDALRAVMLDGQGLGEILPELGLLGAWGSVAFVVALRIFRWE